MANYYSKAKTNYFQVTNPDRFKSLMKLIDFDFYEKEIKPGVYAYCFYGEDLTLSDEIDLDEFSIEEYPGLQEAYKDAPFLSPKKELQNLLLEGEAIIYQEIGYEKLRQLDGYCLVITKNNSCCVDIETWGSATAKDLLSKEKKDCGL